MKNTLTALSMLMLLAAPAAAQNATESPNQPPQFATEQTSSEILASDFTGEPVLDAAGDRIGIVNNLVFDQDGRISLAVIGIGGFLGVGAKQVAVPFESLKAEKRNGAQVLTINATKEQLQAAPAYTTLNDQKFAERYAAWKEKAEEGWSKLSEQAKEAYNKAKTAVTDSGGESTGAENTARPPATKTE
jgi:sporulation protein YlmC with PRC-barrel domain